MNSFSYMNAVKVIIRGAVAILVLGCIDATLTNATPLTNGVSISKNLYFQLEQKFGTPTNRFLANEMISYMIGTTTNRDYVVYRYFPVERSFVFQLLDQTGAPVKKTPRGLEYSKPPHAPKSLYESTKLHLSNYSRLDFLFRPEDMFVLTNKGLYELEISIRLWIQTTNRGAPNEVSQYTQPGIGTNYQFGMVTSPPVRVQIIKE